jgi:alpha-L-fucosidase
LVIDNSGSLAWRLYIPEAGSYKVDLSFHNASDNDMAVDVSSAGQVIHRQFKPTGKVVVEPHDSYTEEFVNDHIGILNFPKAGFYEVTFRANPAAGEKLLFNRIWVAKKK